MPKIKNRTFGAFAVLLLLISSIALAACGGGGSSTASSGGEEATTTTAATTGDSEEAVNVAFLAGIVANPDTKATTEGMMKVAKEENADVTVIDSQFEAEKQYSQMQSLIGTGKYDGIVVLPLNGTSLQPLAEEAISGGTAVGSVDLPLGPDNTTVEPQVEGQAVSVLRPFSVHGENMGELTVEACKGIDPCKVAYMFGEKASPFDQQLFTSFKEAIEKAPNVEIVSELEGHYSREGGEAAAQDAIQANSDLNVLVGVDQSIVGAEPVLQSAGKEGDVALIGYGGTKQAIAGIEAGTWFGDSASAPVVEGELVLKGVIAAIREGKTTGGVDPIVALKVPDNGKITAKNVSRFQPEYEG